MRLYIKLTKNTEIIPFNYQELLTATIHNWLGHDNKYHGGSGVFSFSWLQNTKANKLGIDLTKDSYFFVSSVDNDFIKDLLSGIMSSPEMFCGSSAYDVAMREAPEFEGRERFLMASPLLLKSKTDKRYLTYMDDDFEKALTDNVKVRLEKGGLSSEGVSVKLDPDSSYRTTKMVNYKSISNKTTLAPIVVEGSREQLQFIWLSGIGHSTGIGFGALK